MANKEKLPWDLIEEILTRVPPKSLVRFKIVSKQWNALFIDKRFINKHKKMFRFILRTRSKIYSVSINPKIEVRELTLDIPGLDTHQIPKKLIDCNEFLLCRMDKGAVIWNPWLRQTTWIKSEVNQPNLVFNALGYDNNNGYKTLASYRKELDPATLTCWKTHDLSSDAWRDQKGVLIYDGSRERITFHISSGVSLNGTYYRAASYDKTKYLFFLVNFDFSWYNFNKFCDLPYRGNHDRDALVLNIFRGDRFSLLKQSHLTKKIEILVTKNKIDKWSGGDVEWINFMQVSLPNLPDLVQIVSYDQPSYFIDGKNLVVCSYDETGRVWIYVLGDNKLISGTKIDLVVDPWPLHCTYSPSLLSVPRGKRVEAESQV
ncbi:hypothetical protein EUTSA_v10017596mg [Eutrema salsugineum]|uniref:F-box domain-containing protein n=1 Tax=Eutrema salsugineum TaxID=72664 RepID=V4MI77_EUTSA|nr:putative F-box protein At1g47390 [Eutrema salsugineum]ESQ52283.1 hypothetical protein EUTSA_v10017596mg [Eutrema salsugineum]